MLKRCRTNCRGGPPWPPVSARPFVFEERAATECRPYSCLREIEGPCRVFGFQRCMVQQRGCSDSERRELSGNADHICEARGREGCRRPANTHRRQKVFVSYEPLRTPDCEPHHKACRIRAP